MNTRLELKQWEVYIDLLEEASFLMRYMWEVVEEILIWKRSIKDFEKLTNRVFPYAEQDSDTIDYAYESGAYGRPGIMDGWPNYISYFDEEVSACKLRLLAYLQNN